MCRAMHLIAQRNLHKGQQRNVKHRFVVIAVCLLSDSVKFKFLRLTKLWFLIALTANNNHLERVLQASVFRRLPIISSSMTLPASTPRTSSRSTRKRKTSDRVRQIDASDIAAARHRRLDALESDNYAAEAEAETLAGEDEYDPDADSDDALSVAAPSNSRRNMKRLRSAARSSKQKVKMVGIEKWNKSLAQAIEEEDVTLRPRAMVRYEEIAAAPSSRPVRHFCSVCGYPAAYTCTRCMVRFCCVRCGNIHSETRCLKFTV